MTGKQLKQQRINIGLTTYDLQKAGIGVKTYTAIESDGNYTVKSYKKYLALVNSKTIL